MLFAVEAPLPFCAKYLRRVIESQVQVLSTVDGRGWFLLFCATLCISQIKFTSLAAIFTDPLGYPNLAATFFTLALGFINIFVGYQMTQKLKKLKGVAIGDDGSQQNIADMPWDQLEVKIDEAFTKADVDNSGDLDAKELQLMFAGMNSDLRYGELETALLMLDTDGDGMISRDELKAWYIQDMKTVTLGHVIETQRQEIQQTGKSSLFSSSSDPNIEVHLGPSWLSYLAEIGGTCLLCGGIAGIVDAFLTLEPASLAEILCNLYAMAIGAICITFESTNVVAFDGIRMWLDSNAIMLRFLWGRGLVYIVGGLFFMLQPGSNDLVKLFHTLAGAGMIVVGVICKLLGHWLQCKLNKLKDNLVDEQDLYQRWHSCPMDDKFQMDSEQFPVFLKKCSVDLSYTELRAAIQELDTDNNGKISYNEFLAWWKNKLVEAPPDGTLPTNTSDAFATAAFAAKAAFGGASAGYKAAAPHVQQAYKTAAPIASQAYEASAPYASQAANAAAPVMQQAAQQVAQQTLPAGYGGQAPPQGQAPLPPHRAQL